MVGTLAVSDHHHSGDDLHGADPQLLYVPCLEARGIYRRIIMKVSLSARPPFNFLSVVNSHGWRQLAPFSYDENSNTLFYVLRLSNGHVVELKLRDRTDGVIVE